MLKLGLLFGGSAAALTTLAGWGWLQLPPPAKGRTTLGDDEEGVVRALVDTYFPSSHPIGKDLPVEALLASVDAHVGRLFATEQRAARTLLRVFNQWPRLSLSGGATFADLPHAGRVEVLGHWEESSLEERRGLASLLRILIGMHVFEQPQVVGALGIPAGCAPLHFGPPEPWDADVVDDNKPDDAKGAPADNDAAEETAP